jgi:glycosyltransferase involved in cell wall biosynthesis
MKIIHVVPYIGEEASGPAYSVPRLCEALAKQGCDIVLYTLGPLPKRKFDFRVESFSRSAFPHPSFGFSWKMYKSLLEDAKDAQIIHNHSLWMAPNIFAGLIAEKLNIPLINAPRGTLSEKALNISSFKKKTALFLGQRKALNATNCFHVTANHEANDIRNYQAKTPICIIPNGIDIPVQISKKPKRKTILFLGRIHPIKGIENLINAWKDIGPLFPDWDLKLVGKGNQRYLESLKKLVKDNHIININFEGPAYGNNKNVLYQDASLYVLPSFSENFGMTVAEALANKTPVITTNATPWKDLEIKNCGWCINPTEEDLTITLKVALGLNKENLQEMGINGQNWMMDEYAWGKIAEKTLQTYQWMIDRKLKPEFVKNE